MKNSASPTTSSPAPPSQNSAARTSRAIGALIVSHHDERFSRQGPQAALQSQRAESPAPQFARDSAGAPARTGTGARVSTRRRGPARDAPLEQQRSRNSLRRRANPRAGRRRSRLNSSALREIGRRAALHR